MLEEIPNPKKVIEEIEFEKNLQDDGIRIVIVSDHPNLLFVDQHTLFINQKMVPIII